MVLESESEIGPVAKPVGSSGKGESKVVQGRGVQGVPRWVQCQGCTMKFDGFVHVARAANAVRRAPVTLQGIGFVADHLVTSIA